MISENLRDLDTNAYYCQDGTQSKLGNEPRTESIACSMIYYSSDLARVWIGTADGYIVVRNAGSDANAVVHLIESAHSGMVSCLALSRLGVLSGGMDQVVRLWDFDSMELVCEYHVPTSWIRCIQSVGNMIWVGDNDGSIFILSLNSTMGAICIKDAHRFATTSLAVMDTTLDEYHLTHVASAGKDGILKLWQAHTQKLIWASEDGGGAISSLAKSTSIPGYWVGREDGSLSLWRLVSVSRDKNYLNCLFKLTSNHYPVWEFVAMHGSVWVSCLLGKVLRIPDSERVLEMDITTLASTYSPSLLINTIENQKESPNLLTLYRDPSATALREERRLSISSDVSSAISSRRGSPVSVTRRSPSVRQTKASTKRAELAEQRRTTLSPNALAVPVSPRRSTVSPTTKVGRRKSKEIDATVNVSEQDDRSRRTSQSKTNAKLDFSPVGILHHMPSVSSSESTDCSSEGESSTDIAIAARGEIGDVFEEMSQPNAAETLRTVSKPLSNIQEKLDDASWLQSLENILGANFSNRIITETHGAFAIVSLIRSQRQQERLKGLQRACEVSLTEPNIQLLCNAGIVPVLEDLMQSGIDEEQLCVGQVIAQLARNKNVLPLLVNSSAVAVILGWQYEEEEYLRILFEFVGNAISVEESREFILGTIDTKQVIAVPVVSDILLMRSQALFLYHLSKSTEHRRYLMSHIEFVRLLVRLVAVDDLEVLYYTSQASALLSREPAAQNLFVEYDIIALLFNILSLLDSSTHYKILSLSSLLTGRSIARRLVMAAKRVKYRRTQAFVIEALANMCVSESVAAKIVEKGALKSMSALLGRSVQFSSHATSASTVAIRGTARAPASTVRSIVLLLANVSSHSLLAEHFIEQDVLCRQVLELCRFADDNVALHAAETVANITRYPEVLERLASVKFAGKTFVNLLYLESSTPNPVRVRAFVAALSHLVVDFYSAMDFVACSGIEAIKRILSCGDLQETFPAAWQLVKLLSKYRKFHPQLVSSGILEVGLTSTKGGSSLHLPALVACQDIVNRSNTKLWEKRGWESTCMSILEDGATQDLLREAGILLASILNHSPSLFTPWKENEMLLLANLTSQENLTLKWAGARALSIYIERNGAAPEHLETEACLRNVVSTISLISESENFSFPHKPCCEVLYHFAQDSSSLPILIAALRAVGSVSSDVLPQVTSLGELVMLLAASCGPQSTFTAYFVNLMAELICTSELKPAVFRGRDEMKLLLSYMCDGNRLTQVGVAILLRHVAEVDSAVLESLSQQSWVELLISKSLTEDNTEAFLSVLCQIGALSSGAELISNDSNFRRVLRQYAESGNLLATKATCRLVGALSRHIRVLGSLFASGVPKFIQKTIHVNDNEALQSVFSAISFMCQLQACKDEMIRLGIFTLVYERMLSFAPNEGILVGYAFNSLAALVDDSTSSRISHLDDAIRKSSQLLVTYHGQNPLVAANWLLLLSQFASDNRISGMVVSSSVILAAIELMSANVGIWSEYAVSALTEFAKSRELRKELLQCNCINMLCSNVQAQRSIGMSVKSLQALCQLVDSEPLAKRVAVSLSGTLNELIESHLRVEEEKEHLSAVVFLLLRLTQFSSASLELLTASILVSIMSLFQMERQITGDVTTCLLVRVISQMCQHHKKACMQVISTKLLEVLIPKVRERGSLQTVVALLCATLCQDVSLHRHLLDPSIGLDRFLSIVASDGELEGQKNASAALAALRGGNKGSLQH